MLAMRDFTVISDHTLADPVLRESNVYCRVSLSDSAHWQTSKLGARYFPRQS